jgi:hypothetical protein
MNLLTEFRNDLHITNINFDSSTTIENFDWISAFGASTNRFNIGYSTFIKFRFVSCIIILVSCIRTIADWIPNDCIMYCPMYFTHWVLFINAVYSVTGLISTYRIHHYRDDYTIQQIPLYVKIHWLLQNPSFVFAFLIPILFWSGCAIVDFNESMCNVTDRPITIFVHGINGAIMLTDVIVSNQPYMVLHGVYSLLICVIYIYWSYLHQLFHIGSCTNPNSNIPLYSIIDWENRPEVYKSFILLLGLPIFNCFGWYIYYKKNQVKPLLLIDV